MSLIPLTHAQALGNPKNTFDAIKELQGLNVTIVDGAAAGTKMDIPAMRTEDTIISAIKFTDAAGAPVSDLANITIQGTKATGTITISGNPVADETITVNGAVYVWKAVPTSKLHLKITAGNNTTMAADVAAKINAYEGRYEAALNGDSNRQPAVVATSALGVVTVTSVEDGAGNGPIVTDTGTTITIASTNPGAVTATFVSAGNTDAIIVNGVTFTIKTVPVNLDKDMGVKASDTLQAAETVRIINAYQTKFGGLNVRATNALGVVTLTSLSPKSGNSITLTETSTNVAVSGSGYLSGGTATGGIKSTTDLSVSSLLVTWFNKR
jgi:hypothetical protein